MSYYYLCDIRSRYSKCRQDDEETKNDSFPQSIKQNLLIKYLFLSTCILTIGVLHTCAFFYKYPQPHIKKKHGSAHVDQNGLQGIVTVSYKTYRNTYQISRYISLVEKVYRYTKKLAFSLVLLIIHFCM
jgi:hypothetical protein